MSGFYSVFSGNRRPVFSLPEPDRVRALAARLKELRTPAVHGGINAVTAVYKIARPKTMSQYQALLGLVQMLSDPELSDTDLENLARDILDHWPEVAAVIEV
jgi:hypothetical protein